jgi:hypothetical protein
MNMGLRDSFRFFSVVTFFIILLVLCAGCTLNFNQKGTKVNTTPEDPVTGTWNGFMVTAGNTSIPDPSLTDDVEKIRLNIYRDLSFAYTTNFTIRNGTLIPTGKGNYAVKANETETDRKYFRYHENLDILHWESRNMTLELRRNDRQLTPAELDEYNTRMLETYTREQQAASVTPVPPRTLARILSRGFGYDPTKSTVYQMNGKIEIENGIYESVGIILRYPDNDTFQSDVGGMGGSNFTRKDFRIVIHDRMSNQTPGVFVRLDAGEYPAVETGEQANGSVYTAYEPAR